MHRLLLILCGCVLSVSGFNFDEKDVRVIHVTNNSYFGYKLLLQKGQQPAVIVGAPRQKAGSIGGALYYCTLDGECSNYVLPVDSRKDPNTVNGNLLGSALDGGENTGDKLIVCAPRVVSKKSDQYFLNGFCFVKRNSSSFKTNNNIVIVSLAKEAPIYSRSYYDYGFSEAGLDAHYLPAENKVLLGAPGVKNWNGIFVIQSLTRIIQYDVIPKRSAPIANENFGYLGYTITSARLESSRRGIWYVTGAPRGSQLRGNVKIYDKSGYFVAVITGHETGSYFGSSILAVDVNNDRIDDLLIGAPMGAGSSWDEGYVYFYKSTFTRYQFENHVLLSGPKKMGARFGTSMVSLGDMDLDSYNDVAISAPYEDGGIGAVYIYKGSKTGINPQYSQRLSPTKFYPSVGNVRGFGQGLSRGVDIDGNGHNDLAIGAYKSDQVFIIKSTTIIDIQLSLESNVSSITTNVINIQYCIHYTQRSKTNNLKSINFKMNLFLDYRAEGVKHITEFLNVTLAQNYCKSLDVKLKNLPHDITPFKISLKSEIQRQDVIAKGENQIEKVIPYSHGCGDDNICQTKILVEAVTTLPYIILGLNKEIDVQVKAENVGEPGYACDLNINFPNVIELRDTRDCNLNNDTYMCPFSTRLMDKKETQFKFDIKLRKPELDKVNITFEVKCLGENSPPGINKYELSLGVLLKNSPYIQGSSIPDNFYFDDENMDDVEISHTFNVGNSGPSPVKLDVFILLPIVKKDGSDVFIVDAKGSLDGIEVKCYPKNTILEAEEPFEVQPLLTEPINKTVVIKCFQEAIECLQLYCNGKYLYKSSEIAEHKINIKIKTNLLASVYEKELESKGILAYVSTAYLYDSEKNRIQGHAATQIFASKKKPVPLWIYIVGGIIGILLLGLLIFLLYKCHFFDRNYRDKLKDEKLMDQKIEEEEEDDKTEEEISSS